MDIGPGVAPEAELYAIKIFGCEGSTNLVVEALDWALDPNGDGDFSDHLDVVNMSLGSEFGSPEDPDSVASDNTVEAGVAVIASAGNSGDIYEITGSPGASKRALSVAASEDRGQIVKAFVVLKPGQAAGEPMAKALQDFVKQTIAPYKYPRAVEFRDSLPRTETGKLQRFKLRTAP